MIADRIVHLEELDFTIVAVAHEFYVEYTVFDIFGWGKGESGEYDAPIWCREVDGTWHRPFTTLDEAQPYLHGAVKWDGCSDWHFDEQDRCELHGCSKEDVQRFGAVMAICWDMTAELCPQWYRREVFHG